MSGAEETIPWSIDPYGGSPAEQDACYQGSPGVLMGRAPWVRLFAAWRLLHNLPVGVEAGRLLALPCCGSTWTTVDPAKKACIDARSAVLGAKPVRDYEIVAFRQVGDFFAVPTCFPHAFITAARTLQERIAAHGAEDKWVKVWLGGQAVIFTGCNENDSLPPPKPDAPTWFWRTMRIRPPRCRFTAATSQMPNGSSRQLARTLRLPGKGWDPILRRVP